MVKDSHYSYWSDNSHGEGFALFVLEATIAVVKDSHYSYWSDDRGGEGFTLFILETTIAVVKG